MQLNNHTQTSLVNVSTSSSTSGIESQESVETQQLRPSENNLVLPGEGLHENSLLLVDKALDSYQKAQNLHIDIAQKVFVSKLFNLASIGAISVLQIAQLLTVGKAEEINPMAATVGLMGLGVAAADCGAAFIDYMSKKSGGTGLSMGADAIAGAIHYVALKCGMSEKSAESSSKNISTVARGGLMLTQLAQTFGKLTGQVVSKIVDLPTSVTEFTNSLSPNISSEALSKLPSVKITLEHLSEGAQVFTKYFAREADELSTTSKTGAYLLNSETVVEVQGKTALLSTLGKIAAYSTGSKLVGGVSLCLNAIHGAGKFLEGQAGNISNVGSSVASKLRSGWDYYTNLRG